MRKRYIKSGKVPVGTGVGANLYATVNPRPKGSGSRLREAASPASPEAAPARGTCGTDAIAARLPPCMRSAAASSGEAGATLGDAICPERKPAICPQVLGLSPKLAPPTASFVCEHGSGTADRCRTMSALVLQRFFKLPHKPVHATRIIHEEHN